MTKNLRQAPDLQIESWLNTDSPLTLESLSGSVILIEAFQMLCPGCVSHTLPQAQRIRAAFPEPKLAIIGLHTVFEHHSTQGTAEALMAFLSEYKIEFPVGIDRPQAKQVIPTTMATYGMQGTPTQILIDRNGFIRSHRFGRASDIELARNITTLLMESEEPISGDTHGPELTGRCTAEGCFIPRS